jgi:hypothetical protein
MHLAFLRFPIIFILLLSFAVIGQYVAYVLPSADSRILLLLSYLALVSVILVACSDRVKASPTAQKFTVFILSFGVSLAFVLKRYYLMAPGFMLEVVHSEFFVAAQNYVQSGVITSGLQHSFLFQEPLILSSIMNVSGMSVNTVVYISLAVYAIMIAFAATLLFGIARNAFGNRGSIASLMPGIIVFSMISFAYSQRTEIGISLMLLLLCFLFVGNLSRGKTLVVILLVIAITFGSATSMLVIIPFSFVFALLNERKPSLVYGIIPLGYLVSAGSSYLISINSYNSSAITGLFYFFQEIVTGHFAQRVLPWQRSSLTTVGDTYITSLAYVSLVAVCGLVLLIGLLAWRNKRIVVKNYEKALYQAAVVVGILLFVIAVMAYIGASVEPESTSSDIRTIALVLVTLLLPFLLVCRKISDSLSGKRLLMILMLGLLIFASFRTFYELYPKSIHDPINVVEDVRVNPFSVYAAGDFLGKFTTNSSTIVFDYKTSGIAISLVNGTSRSSLFTLTVGSADMVVFDTNGLTLGSLYTSPQAYMEAMNQSSSQNLIYNDGSVYVVMQK